MDVARTRSTSVAKKLLGKGGGGGGYSPLAPMVPTPMTNILIIESWNSSISD